MKTLTLFLLYCCLLPLAAGAQTAEALLQKVPEAIASGQTGYAESLFRQACHANTSQAEMFYWTSVDKSSELAVRFAASLAECFKDAANYDKAYLFYKEQLAHKPDDVTLLVACGDVEVRRGKLADALETYEKVIGLDPDNLQACIFLGNAAIVGIQFLGELLLSEGRECPQETGCRLSPHSVAHTHAVCPLPERFVRGIRFWVCQGAHLSETCHEAFPVDRCRLYARADRFARAGNQALKVSGFIPSVRG